MSESNRSSNNRDINEADGSPLHSPSSSNHSIISIQSIHSINPISTIPQTTITTTNQYALYTQYQHQSNQMQPPSISTNINNPFIHQNQSTLSNIENNDTNSNNRFSHLQPPPPPSHQSINHLLNSSSGSSSRINHIQNPPVPIPTNAVLPPMTLPLPSFHNQQRTQRSAVKQTISPSKNVNNKKRKRSSKSKKSRSKKQQQQNEDIYYYQLERACGLEVQESKDSHNAEAELPPARFSHCCCIHEDALYVYGGRNQTRTFYPVDNELWRYNLCTKRWTKMKPKLNPYYKSTETYHGSNPQPRTKPFAVVGATAIVYQDCIYIFGGYHSRYTNALLKYDILNNYWCVVDARGDIPPRRWEYSACLYKNKMYIFGGTMDRTHYNDLYSFDFHSSRWTELHPVNGSNVPPPRRRHKAVVYQKKMWVFGGREDPISISQNLQIYDFKTGAWSKISCADSYSSISIPMAINHSLYVHKPDGLLYVFGCQDAPVVTYDFKLNRWYPVSSRNYERHGLSLCTTHHGSVNYWRGALYIFGGQSRDKMCKRDLLKFSLNPQAQYTRDMLSMLNNKRLSDITFKITEDDSFVYAHKFVLFSRCEYFQRMFSGNFAESNENESIINIDNCSKKVFLSVLRYFYTDELWNPTNVNDTLEMLGLADLYQFSTMRSHCCKILENSICISNAILLLQASRKFNLINLKNYCKDFIMANFAKYQNTLGLMGDLIELIQICDKQKNENKDTDNESPNEWKGLHNEIMNAMGKLFVSDDRKLSERQKQLKVHLTKKDVEEYKKTHQAMICAAKLGNKRLIKRKKKCEIRTLDDDEANDEEADDEYSDDGVAEDNGTVQRPSKRRRILIPQQPQVQNQDANDNEDENPPMINNNNNNNRSLVNGANSNLVNENLPYLVADVHRDQNG